MGAAYGSRGKENSMPQWLDSLIRYSPDNGDGGGGVPETPPAGAAPAPEPPAADSQEQKPSADPEKYVPLEKHKKIIEKARALESELEKYRKAEEERKKAEMTELQRLQLERDEARRKAEQLEVEHAKSAALREALRGIGENYEIPAAELEDLEASISALAYNPDTYKQDIARLVNLAKKTKGSPVSVIGNPPKHETPASSKPDLSAWERPGQVFGAKK